MARFSDKDNSLPCRFLHRATVSSANLSSSLLTCIGWRWPLGGQTQWRRKTLFLLRSLRWRWPICLPVRKCRPKIWCNANGHWRNPVVNKGMKVCHTKKLESLD